SFPSLKIEFSIPSEMVSTEEPSMALILDELIKLDNSIGIPDVSEDSQSLLKNIFVLLEIQMVGIYF
ncbi:MAG: hypothetical protein RBR99_02545, partial [Dehalococcoidales bacterium]|nr:hypothetical protein [Dehalococcoidales bacterium]